MIQRQDRGGVGRRAGPAGPLRMFAKGLLTGAIGTGVAAGTVLVILVLDRPDPGACAGEPLCVAGLGPLITAVSTVPMMMAPVGPLVGWLLDVPEPHWFAMPTALAVVLLCAALWPAGGHQFWPLTRPVALVLILWMSYGLVGLWIYHRRNGYRPAP